MRLSLSLSQVSNALIYCSLSSSSSSSQWWGRCNWSSALSLSLCALAFSPPCELFFTSPNDGYFPSPPSHCDATSYSYPNIDPMPAVSATRVRSRWPLLQSWAVLLFPNCMVVRDLTRTNSDARCHQH
ncbi:unnamed protein product [Musa acuminata var. zebrina]